MPTETFGRGAVPARGQPIDVATFRKGGLLTGQVPAVPSRESLRPVDRQVSAPANAANLQNQHFFSKGHTPAFTPRPFSEQQAQVAKVVNGAAANRPAGTAQTGARETGKSGGVNQSQSAGARSTDERGNVSARGGVSVNERLGGEKSAASSETNIGADGRYVVFYDRRRLSALPTTATARTSRRLAAPQVEVHAELVEGLRALGHIHQRQHQRLERNRAAVRRRFEKRSQPRCLWFAFTAGQQSICSARFGSRLTIH